MNKISFLIFVGILQSPLVEANQYVVGPEIESNLQDQVCKINLLSGDSEGICTGVRLDETTILTAEHCARNIDSGVLNDLPEVICGGRSLEAISMNESNQYFYFKDKGIRAFFRAGVDFSIIKLKKNKDPFIPKFKIHENFQSFKEDFLVSSDNYNYTFSKSTICEVHGFGMDELDNLGILNSSQISTSPSYMNRLFNIIISPIGEFGHTLMSPLLPMRATNWQYTYVRPGDSGGPMFCLNEKNEWILSGIASTLQTGECPQEIKKLSEKNSKLKCAQNSWGIPTKETLKQLFEDH